MDYEHAILSYFKLPRQLTKTLTLLFTEPIVTTAMIQQRLEIKSDPRVLMLRMRRAMDKHDIQIKSQKYVGYWIEDEFKERIRRLIAGMASGGGMASTGDKGSAALLDENAGTGTNDPSEGSGELHRAEDTFGVPEGDGYSPLGTPSDSDGVGPDEEPADEPHSGP